MAFLIGISSNRRKVSKQRSMQLYAFVLVGCGGSETENQTNELRGFVNYNPPRSDFDFPEEIDPYFKVLQTPQTDPYWIAALEMDQYEIFLTPMLEDFDRVIEYTFPNSQPNYEHQEIVGWAPASEKMKFATRQILSELEIILDVSFVEGTDPMATNVISIARSEQLGTAGYSFYPNTYYQLGMDVFISKDFDSPDYNNSVITNYDYEVLVHEIGHALGLKHPFEPDGLNTSILTIQEDNTVNTVMSYTDDVVTFNGLPRPFDWMALTKFYGVKSTYKAGDDTYTFSSSGGTFIIDGAGIDTISATETSRDVTLDLRPGAHNHLGSKSSYITSANQLTISHGSDIENVETGSGNDTVIATDLDNIIATGSGDDTIFAGGGADVIRSGTGSDRIDLSEVVQVGDLVAVDASLFDLGFDTIYGFAQGVGGDVLDLSGLLSIGAQLLPLVVAGAAPLANFSDGVLRVVGDALETSEDIATALGIEGSLSSLSLPNGARSIIVSAASQDTGEGQSVFYAEGNITGIQISQLALLQGNALDIDQWHVSNFGLVA